MTAPTMMTNFRGKLIPLVDAIRMSGTTISEAAIRYRLSVRGWDIERALSEPQTFGGRFPRSQEQRQILLAKILELRASGLTNSEIGTQLGLPRSAVHGLTYRQQTGKVPRPHRKRGKAKLTEPIPMTALEAGKPICWMSGCEDARLDHSKFCERHSFRPRTDQPMHRLMAARA